MAEYRFSPLLATFGYISVMHCLDPQMVPLCASAGFAARVTHRERLVEPTETAIAAITLRARVVGSILLYPRQLLLTGPRADMLSSGCAQVATSSRPSSVRIGRTKSSLRRSKKRSNSISPLWMFTRPRSRGTWCFTSYLSTSSSR